MSIAPEPLIVNVVPSTVTDTATCSICLSELSSQDGRYTLKCQHTFHPRCVTEWLVKGNTNCPMCRVSIGELDGIPIADPKTCGMTKNQWAKCRKWTKWIYMILTLAFSVGMIFTGLILAGTQMPSPQGAFFAIGSILFMVSGYMVFTFHYFGRI